MSSIRHYVNCGGGEAGALAAGRKTLELSLHGEARNVTVNIDGLSMALSATLPPALIDLIEIATYVYAADRLIKRGTKKQLDMGESWVRDLQFRIPIRDLDTIQGVATELESTLGFLSHDKYSFHFVQGESLPSCPEGLFQGQREPHGIQDVILFSGGLDSTAGAMLQAVKQERRIVLVNHEAITKVRGWTTRLVKAIAENSTHDPLLIRVKANLVGEDTKETTQRSRSFLYMTIGLAVARALGIDEVKFFENGPLSLNIPLAENIKGSRATRSTHPKVLSGFERIAKAVAKQKVIVDNPFFWSTKTDVVQLFQEAGHPQLIGLTRSCAATFKGSARYPHCGTCSQCIDRRFAVLAAEASDQDDVSKYEVDPILGELTEDSARTTAVNYVRTARKLHELTPVGVLSEYSSLTDAGRHLGGDVDSKLLEVAAMLKRHASQVLTGLKLAVESASEQFARGEIHSGCLLALALPARGPSSAREEDDHANLFSHRGKLWKVCFQGSGPFRFPDRKGFRELQFLLAKPGSMVDALDLYNIGVPEDKQLISSGAEPDMDDDSYRATIESIRKLKRELEKAEANNDDAAQARIRKERGEVLAHLRKHTDKEGRIRMTDKAVEKARSTVSHRIDRVLKNIREECPELADHLQHPNLSRGAQFCYSPGAPAPKWST